MRPTHHPDSQDLSSQYLLQPLRIGRARHFLARAGITISLLGLTASAAVAADTCVDARSLTLPSTLVASAEPETAEWFSVEVEAGRFLLAEAQGTGIGTHRPRIRLFDDRCRPLEAEEISEPKRGRRAISIESNQTVLVEVRPPAESQIFILDLWTDAAGTSTVARRKDGDEESPNPVPQAPIDEWDELQAGGCAVRITKDGDEEDPNPVPQAPIDEWDEIQTQGRDCDPVVWDELRGLGAVAVVGRKVRSRSWCEWAGRPGLLATFSCARKVRLQAGERATIERILSDRPEMLALELDSAGILQQRGAAGWTIYSAAGDVVADSESVALERGSYFVQIHDPDSVYEMTVLP